MSGPALEFLRYLAGLRGPYTSLTAQETALLSRAASGCQCVIEVGVHEGATSAVIAKRIHKDGFLYLVDPYIPATRIEVGLRFSWSYYVARRSLRPAAGKARFVRLRSLEAASKIALHRPADLIFIDADHSYEAVSQDFHAWAPHLATGGVIALHDSRLSPLRPDLGSDAGPVRLAKELSGNAHGQWMLADAVDTLSVLKRKLTTAS
jgi:predicted O-methyltransferase YrrM